MNFDFFDFLSICGDFLSLFNGGSSDVLHYDISEKKKERKYVFEKIGIGLYVFSAVFFFLVFKDPIISDNYTQSVVVASLLGFGVSLVIFFVLYLMGKYYFKNIFQWLFFSLSVLLLSISFILWIYFKSGIF